MKQKRIVFSMITIFLSSMLYINTGFSASKSLTIGVNPWPENIAVAHLWKQLLEARGYNIKLHTGGKAPLFAGVANGSLDLDFEAWLPTSDRSYYKKFEDNLSLIGPWVYHAKEGLVVPDYVAIKSIPELKNHADQFTRSGQPTITGIGAGAAVTQITEEAIKTYNLPLTLNTSSGAAMMAALDRAYSRKQPIVVTLWKPHWAWAQYDLHFLKDPKNLYGEPDSIYIFVHKGFKLKHPKVTIWLSRFSLSEQKLADLMNSVRQAGSPQDVIKKWRKNHSDLVSTWFEK